MPYPSELDCWVSIPTYASGHGDTLSNWKQTKGGIPQGTKLGVILFTVMTNRLLSDWHLKIKYVDDTTAVEILPKNSISYLNTVVSDILQFSTEHGLKLNPLKCKEMLINFMTNPNFIAAPINIGNRIVDPVTSYKILGVIIDNDHRWNSHVDYICKKASKETLFCTTPEASWGREKKYTTGIHNYDKTNTRVCCTGLAGNTNQSK